MAGSSSLQRKESDVLNAIAKDREGGEGLSPTLDKPIRAKRLGLEGSVNRLWYEIVLVVDNGDAFQTPGPAWVRMQFFVESGPVPASVSGAFPTLRT